MKSIIIVMSVLMIAGVLAMPTALVAEDKAGEKKVIGIKAEIPEGFNAQTICPVMGGKITSTSFVDYQGQRVYFCCPGCEGSFLAEPEKYFEAAAKDSILFENVQTTCPVTGEPIDRKFFAYYKGRGIYFCCADCIEKFNADPDKYLDAMIKAGEQEKQKGHEGHGHGGHEGHDHGHDHDQGH